MKKFYVFLLTIVMMFTFTLGGLVESKFHFTGELPWLTGNFNKLVHNGLKSLETAENFIKQWFMPVKIITAGTSMKKINNSNSWSCIRGP
ncbi:MAG: hypothetical protein H0Z40_10850 [Desulfotomaculum sp.]|nr:hypothetical protein [Desulfotomaculum sp.]